MTKEYCNPERPEYWIYWRTRELSKMSGGERSASFEKMTFEARQQYILAKRRHGLSGGRAPGMEVSSEDASIMFEHIMIAIMVMLLGIGFAAGFI